jgi:hypothetical protein
MIKVIENKKKKKKYLSSNKKPPRVATSITEIIKFSFFCLTITKKYTLSDKSIS